MPKSPKRKNFNRSVSNKKRKIKKKARPLKRPINSCATRQDRKDFVELMRISKLIAAFYDTGKVHSQFKKNQRECVIALSPKQGGKYTGKGTSRIKWFNKRAWYKCYRVGRVFWIPIAKAIHLGTYNLEYLKMRGEFTVSHKCHQPTCFNIAHVILEELGQNQVRSSCPGYPACDCPETPCLVKGKLHSNSTRILSPDYASRQVFNRHFTF